MADSFFGFEANMPGRDEGMNALEPEEEEYDAFNDETFGNDLTFESAEDWEEDHEKFSGISGSPSAKASLPSPILAAKLNARSYEENLNARNFHRRSPPGLSRQYQGYDAPGHSSERTIEDSISQLVLDDEMDDPAIMDISRTRPLPMPSKRQSAYSPPPPALVESDHVGSPSTNSIWSASHNQYDQPSLSHSNSGNSMAALINSLKKAKPSIMGLQFEDPSIISATKNLPPPGPHHHHQHPHHNQLQPLQQRESAASPRGSHHHHHHLIPNVKTVEEVERDLLLEQQQVGRGSGGGGSSSVGSPIQSHRVHTLDEVERDILLKPRVRTVSEIEQEIQRNQPQQLQLMQRNHLPCPGHPMGPPPGYRNGGIPGATYRDHQPMHMPPPHMSSSPLAIPGHRMSMSPTMHGRVSPSPPLAMASPPMRTHSPPVYQGLGLLGSAPMRIQPCMTRMIPPQLTTYPRHPYLNHVTATGQPLMVGHLRYPPGLKSGHPLPPGMLPFPPLVHPGGYPDARHVRMMPPPNMQHHPLMNQNNHRVNFPRRNSGSENVMHHNSINHHGYPTGDPNCNVDEYANLMSQYEKDWVVKIQLMQLQTDNPYLDDYYFTTFMLKKIIKENKDSSKNNQEPSLVIPERSKVVDPKTYRPAHFEGSLGKLQVMSVNCPRKMIDLSSVHPEDPELDTQKFANRDLKRFRQTLLEVEKLYNLFLETDDIDKKAAALPVEAHAPLHEAKKDIIFKLYSGLCLNNSDHFLQIMSIRKGKKLVLKSIALFMKDQVYSIICGILSNFSLILKRDRLDDTLPQFKEVLSNVVLECNFTQVVELGLRLMSHPVEGFVRVSPVKQKSHFPVAIQNKIGLIVVCELISRAEELYKSEDKSELSLHLNWTEVVLHVVDTLQNTSDGSLPKLGRGFPDLEKHFQRFSVDTVKLDAVKQKIASLQENCS